ncbi:MAG TPA: hypothetical protein VFD57_02910 [Clostridia bacterium]|nr:hypothetical protein [Clostridia bacterium]
MFSVGDHMRVNEEIINTQKQVISNTKALEKELKNILDGLVITIEDNLKLSHGYTGIIEDVVIDGLQGIKADANTVNTLKKLARSIEKLKYYYWNLACLINKEEKLKELEAFPVDIVQVLMQEDGNLYLHIDDVPPLRNQSGKGGHERWRTMIQHAIIEYYENKVPQKDFIYVWYEFGFPSFSTDIDNYFIRSIDNGIKNSGLIKDDSMEYFMCGWSVKKSDKPYTKIWIKSCSKDTVKRPF